MEARLKSAQSNFNLFDHWGEKFSNNIVTQDETTLSKNLPESKRDSWEWRKFDEQQQIKMRCSRNEKREVMFSIFLDSERNHFNRCKLLQQTCY